MNDNVVSRLTFELHVQHHIWYAVIHCVCITVVFIIYSVVFTISPQIHNELWTEELYYSFVSWHLHKDQAGFFLTLVDLRGGGVVVGVRDSGSLVWVDSLGQSRVVSHGWTG